MIRFSIVIEFFIFFCFRYGVVQQKTEMDAQRGRVADLEKKLAEAIEDKEKAKKRLQTQMNEILKKRREEQEEKLQSAMAIKETEIEALRSQLTSSADSLTKMSEDFHASRREMENLQKSITTLEATKVS